MTVTYISYVRFKGLLALGILFFVIVTSASAATLYKWVDENGEIRYSDRLPPSQVKHKRETLNEQGVVVDTTEAAKTGAERKAQEDAKRVLEAQLAKEKRLKAEQDKHDRVLLLTFSSEEEMETVHQDRTEVINSVIRLIKNSLTTTEERLIKLEERADSAYISKGKTVPGGLAQNIEHFSRKITNRKEQLRLKEQEKSKIDQQFETDLARFRLLKTGVSQ